MEVGELGLHWDVVVTLSPATPRDDRPASASVAECTPKVDASGESPRELTEPGGGSRSWAVMGVEVGGVRPGVWLLARLLAPSASVRAAFLPLWHHHRVSESVIRYDEIGASYAAARRADPRISVLIRTALGDAFSVVNVGAGTGSYEPPDRQVVAVEPSRVMITQRAAFSAPVIQGVAQRLPFRTRAFDAAMAILTMHHWSDPRLGLAELSRVARRIVILTIDPEFSRSFWLTEEYFPGIGDWDADHFMSIEVLRTELGDATVLPVPVPYDCQDGFLAAYWRRPGAYLDPEVRAGISTFAMLEKGERETGLRRLAQDLESGEWADRHRSLQNLDALDAGYRLIVSS